VNLRTSLAVLLLAALTAGAGEREGIHNGGFELGLVPDASRPRHWNVGFPGDETPFPGTWELLRQAAAGSTGFLEIASQSKDRICVFSQIVDLPAAVMAGVSLRLRLRAKRRSGPGWVGAQLVAINPEVPVDPETGIPHVGFVQLTTASGAWAPLEGSITLQGAAQLIAVVLFVGGEETVGDFDDVSVTADMEFPPCGPFPIGAEPLHDGLPPFPIGITNENPRNASDAGRADLVARATETVDMVNLFVHIRWNGLRNLPMLAGHDRVIDTAARLARAGLPRMLTFDFTHDSVEGIGDLNPLPDGTLPGRLDDPGVSEAYLDELEALTEAMDPEIVSVGIETDFFWRAHPGQWPAFRDLLCTANTRLEARHPGIHVTTYFTLSSLVDSDGAPVQSGQDALRSLLPCIDSVGYSDYWADGNRHVEDIPPGYFLAAGQVAPGLPLILPELGYRADAVYPESEQEAYLRRLFSELGQYPVRAAVLYSLYDQAYLGAPAFFKTAFGGLGLIRLDGTPKKSFVLLHRTRRSFAPPVFAEPRLQCLPGNRKPAGRRLPAPIGSSPALPTGVHRDLAQGSQPGPAVAGPTASLARNLSGFLCYTPARPTGRIAPGDSASQPSAFQPPFHPTTPVSNQNLPMFSYEH